MINKKNLWFLTLFSLILVLSIYYITMPSELLISGNTIEEKNEIEPTISIEEANELVALRVESDEKVNKEIEEQRKVLSKSDSSVSDKNKAYEKIKELNDTRSEEEKLESLIKEQHKLDSYIKINSDGINVTIKSSEKSESLANSIIRTVQSNYKDQKYITIKFQG